MEDSLFEAIKPFLKFPNFTKYKKEKVFKNFKKDINEVEEFDFIQGKAKFIDFGLYATEPDQIERYYQTISLIQHLNNLKEYMEQGTIVL